MSGETLKLLLFLFAGAGVALAFHLLVGRLRSRIERRLTAGRSTDIGEDTAPTLDPLLAEWLARGLRMAIWLIFFVYTVQLLPETRTQFDSATDRLLHAHGQLLEWLLGHGITAIIIAAVTIFLVRFVGALVKTGFELVERRSAQRGDTSSQRRLQTLSAIMRRAAQSVVLFIGLLEILHQLNLNITPILASAGVVGIAVGFGAQSLIRDLFAGLLILIEDQYRVGDVIRIGETSGAVENLTLRATFIRSIDGALTIVPNGTISTVANLARDWARAVVDVEVDYREDLDRAMTLMLDTAGEMRTERPLDLIDEPAMLGVDRLTNTSAFLRMTVKTAPGRQFEVTRELRRRIKHAFDKAGIRIAPSMRLQGMR
ncbi:MAG: mechanosensitive ion channel [Acidobacteria bacterium]|nr:mechanosensitive ion channel [Acidobacteriota bacterium]MCW5968415.1 mechanosensitive ion channel [Blastocatellales bacterium]